MGKRILYITYLGILEPIPQSQVLPYLFELSKHFKIHLLSFEKAKILRNNRTQIKLTKERLSQKGIDWIMLYYHKRPLVLSSLFDIFIGMIVSLFLIYRFKISIIHARSNIPIAIGYALKTLLPIKLLYDRRGIMGEDHTEHSGWKKGGYLYRTAIWFEAKALKKSNAIVVLTKRMNLQLKNNLNSYKNILIRTIPCCVNLELFCYRDNRTLKERLDLSKKFVLIYSGSLGTYNLLDEMLDFFKEMLQLIPNAHFVILSQNKDTVFNLIMKRKDLDRNKIMLTDVFQEELPVFLSMADAGLVFRRTSPTAIAASPTKFAEYLACGLPVISTPEIGDLEEIINTHKVGVVLAGYGKNEYKQAINKLLGLLKEGDILKERCRKVAESIFSLNGGVKAYSDIYNYLISN